jgi:uncharacterized RDD family membrane protein YckC
VQTSLPFAPANTTGSALAARPVARTRRRLTIEIPAQQGSLSFTVPENHHPMAAAPPVAPLGRRALAWLTDTSLVVLCWAGFFAALRATGIRPGTPKIELAVGVATLLLLYLQYFVVFTLLLGVTPGMRLLRLRVIGFDGQPPEARQFFWRGFGYAVSVTGGLLGFLWGLCDSDRLCWHDRISETYLTTAGGTAPLAARDSATREQPEGRSVSPPVSSIRPQR